MFSSKRDVLLLLIGISLISLTLLYMRPFPLFDCKQTKLELAIVDEILDNDRSVPVNFESVSQFSLAFLLKGVYLSELISFNCDALSFGVDLESVEQGHAGAHKDTLFVFLRRSKTLSDFAHDALVFSRAHSSKGRVYAGPDKLAKAVIPLIRKLIEKHNAKRLVITGISLGAAIGAIAAEHFADEIETNLILFNSFQIGDDEFRSHVAMKVKNAYYIKNINDHYSCPINSRIGIPILFDKKASSKSDHHCRIAGLLRSVSKLELISDRSFYFSDECLSFASSKVVSKQGSPLKSPSVSPETEWESPSDSESDPMPVLKL